MNKKQINESIMYVFIATFVLSSIAVSNTNTAFAFLGFLLGGGDESDTGASTSTTSPSSNTATSDAAAEDQTPSSPYTKSQSSSSLQSAECYSPQGHIIDSCNSGDPSENNDDGYITSSQYQYQ